MPNFWTKLSVTVFTQKLQERVTQKLKQQAGCAKIFKISHLYFLVSPVGVLTVPRLAFGLNPAVISQLMACFDTVSTPMSGNQDTRARARSTRHDPTGPDRP